MVVGAVKLQLGLGQASSLLPATAAITAPPIPVRTTSSDASTSGRLIVEMLNWPYINEVHTEPNEETDHSPDLEALGGVLGARPLDAERDQCSQRSDT